MCDLKGQSCLVLFTRLRICSVGVSQFLNLQNLKKSVFFDFEGNFKYLKIWHFRTTGKKKLSYTTQLLKFEKKKFFFESEPGMSGTGTWDQSRNCFGTGTRFFFRDRDQDQKKIFFGTGIRKKHFPGPGPGQRLNIAFGTGTKGVYKQKIWGGG